MIFDTPASQPDHPSNRHAALQPGSRPTSADSSAATPDRSSFRSIQSHPDSRVPISEHAAAYLHQWDAGRAALSPNTSNRVVKFPASMLENPRSAVPAIGVPGSTAGAEERAEVAEASARAHSIPVPVPGGSNGIDIVMHSPEAEVPEDDKSRSSEVRPTKNNSGILIRNQNIGSHTSSELKGNVEIKQEHKAAGNGQRDIKGEHPKLMHKDDDDDADVEVISWKKVNNKTTAEDHRGASAKTKEAKLDRVIKRGVAYVKKPEPKRKGKAMPKHVG